MKLRHKIMVLAAVLVAGAGAAVMLWEPELEAQVRSGPDSPSLAASAESPVIGGQSPVHFERASTARALVSQSPVPHSYAYNPTDGTVSQGDIWRVKNGNPSAPLYWVSASNAKQYNTERYTRIDDSAFKLPSVEPLSTFSVDVDTASYANMRRYLTGGSLPPADALRIEEMVNYFTYDYPAPTNSDPFSVSVEVAECPWELQHRLVRIGLRGHEVDLTERPASNIVLLADVSGSMDSPNKLPLLQQSLKMLTDQLDQRDTISIVVYAGASGLALPPTKGNDRDTITAAIDAMQAGGSTNGGAGIQLAYDVAKQNFVQGGVNRVILATDGDFNVGVNGAELTRVIEEKAKSGVFLSILGFGMGNFNDELMEELSNRGNGNYAYIDTARESKKVLVEQMTGTLITIAKDVKIQVEFNPAQVQAYRLVGYENRILAAQDFNDDRKDAGEIGAGHMVTALYEIVPPGIEIDVPEVDALKYKQPGDTTSASDEMLTVKLRYKDPDGDTSKLIEVPVRDCGARLTDATDDFVFAASVASFGMLLRDSKYQGMLTLEGVEELAASTSTADASGLRAEFVQLVRKARELKGTM